MTLTRLVYVSSAVEELGDEVLDEILASSVRHNSPQQVTGMLLYSKGGFMQVLEGDEAAIDETFLRIKSDARHHAIFVLSKEPVGGRDFSGWSMGFRRLTTTDVQMLQGFAPFFTGDFEAAQFGIHRGVALELLKQFGEN